MLQSGARSVNTLNPYMPGQWYVGGFEHVRTELIVIIVALIMAQRATHLLAHYDALGLTRNANVDAVKRAYRTLARLYHPDMNDGDDTDGRMKRINEAYTQKLLRNKRNKL